MQGGKGLHSRNDQPSHRGPGHRVNIFLRRQRSQDRARVQMGRKRPEEQAAVDPLIFIYLPKRFQKLPLPHVAREQGPGDRDPQRLGQLCGACFIADVLRTRAHTDDPHGGDLTDLAQLLHPGLNAAAHLPDDRDSRQSDCHASSISSL